jgi:hypothetical protein
VENLRFGAKLYETWYLLGRSAEERGTSEFVHGPPFETIQVGSYLCVFISKSPFMNQFRAAHD